MSLLLILPHQLFNYNTYPKDIEKVILYEHPQYFTRYNYNKKKLILHKGSMTYYKEYLTKNGFKVSVQPYNKKLKISTKVNGYYFDPIDHIDGLPEHFTMLESPNFILTLDDYSLYRDKTDKFVFNNFYMWGKKLIDVLPKIKSTDKENRNKMPDDVMILDIPSNKSDKKYIDIGTKYVNKYFPTNLGNTESDFVYPLTHSTAKRFLSSFIAKKLDNFGKYQDAMIESESFLFHSVLSSSMNIGLIQPIDVLEEVLEQKGDTHINNIESFIRQIFWREYNRYCYIYAPKGLWDKNYFNNKKRLTKEWYNGTLGILPVDDCIRKGIDMAYLHHIERLMVMCNFMNLSQIAPEEVYRWFMEFSIDAYDWVMCMNVFQMGMFATGRVMMRRPYVSTSNYILKMSNYPKGSWNEIWDDMYYDFIRRNKKKLYKFRYYFRLNP